jgi:hypothetical protein
MKVFITQVLRRFRRRELWTIKLYRFKGGFDFNFYQKIDPYYTLSSKGLRYSVLYESTIADPFLVYYNGQIFLFYESKSEFDIGVIKCVSFLDKEDNIYRDYGIVLKEDFHLSFPNVFSFEQKYYMIPESVASGKVLLYKALEFPSVWTLDKVLINESLADVAVHIDIDVVHLFGTDQRGGLRHYTAKSFYSEFKQQPYLISDDLKMKRNGGTITSINGELYRFAQGSENHYGEKLHIKRLDQLSLNGYVECEAVFDLVKHPEDCFKLGHHHISIVEHGNYTWVALDGFCRDNYFNFFAFMFIKIKNSVKF